MPVLAVQTVRPFSAVYETGAGVGDFIGFIYPAMPFPFQIAQASAVFAVLAVRGLLGRDGFVFDCKTLFCSRFNGAGQKLRGLLPDVFFQFCREE